MTQLVLILDSIRSSANVGSILRTADAAGIQKVVCCGTAPYPRLPNDTRDPVVINRNHREIAKTALGAETSVQIEYISSTVDAIAAMRDEHRTIYALEQADHALDLTELSPSIPAALIVGNEVDGVSREVLEAADAIIEIPQYGSKESLNVGVATGIAVYRLLHFK